MKTKAKKPKFEVRYAVLTFGSVSGFAVEGVYDRLESAKKDLNNFPNSGFGIVRLEVLSGD